MDEQQRTGMCLSRENPTFGLGQGSSIEQQGYSTIEKSLSQQLCTI